MTKQTFKDRKRDPNPKARPPAAQVKEQKIRGRAGKDVPQKPSTTKPKAPRTAAQKAARRARDTARAGDTTARKDQSSPGQVANALLRVTDTQEGTIHEEARRLKIRQTSETSPVEVVTVEGNKVEVVARPEVLAPVELAPHRRDTVLKDRLRESDSHAETLIADAVSVTHTPDWHEYALAAEKASPQGKAVSGPLKQGK